ncbi:hypothetical protein GT037_004571 [Alternaria burnsii]|uniref:Uncharacterized protein n=1 Tax=Alternaria burnsii TaxID=1187904 RepID=A0A8H7B7D0_9PLEO|nr:uncharacterized protein GT037_004571 [Alternaria burnsii]KAF7677712.1 hypothetical protein GT037_004571 [Alternaria burnsii]CAI9626169.1 unnamed protein product [Alternaria burnsii]
MPAAFIEFPPVYPQIEPYVLKKTLASIPEDRVFTVNDKYNTLIGGGQHKPDHAMGVARILAVHFGHLPDGFAKEVLGVETADLTKYGQIQRAIMNELYGKSSFLYEYVRGEVSADACATTISNWDLCARQCDFAVDGESNEQRATRISDRDRYRQAIVQLQQEIRDTYKAGIVDANELMNNDNAKSYDKLVARQNAIFWDKKKDEVPQSCFTGMDLIANVRELEMLKPRPLFARKDSERDYFWKNRIKGDLITTVFRLAKGMVDLRTLIARKDWARVWIDKLISTMDIMHRSVITLEFINLQRETSTDPVIRASFELALDRASMNASIRDLVDRVDEPAETWRWRKVPVTTGHKEARRACKCARERHQQEKTSHPG